MKGFLVSLIFLISLGHVFSCQCKECKQCQRREGQVPRSESCGGRDMGRCVNPDNCYTRKGVPVPVEDLPRIYKLDTQPDHEGCLRDEDRNRWCQFWADPKGCFRNGKGFRWCYAKVPKSKHV